MSEDAPKPQETRGPSEWGGLVGLGGGGNTLVEIGGGGMRFGTVRGWTGKGKSLEYKKRIKNK